MTMLNSALPAINDIEGSAIPESMPYCVDAHVHIFPPGIFRAVWKWFDLHGWPIRHRLRASEVFEFLLQRGVGHIIALQYAHKPNMARELNRFMIEQCRKFPHKVSGMATVFPGEPGSEKILEDAFASGLKGVKLHAHVQCFDMNRPEMDPIYHVCCAHAKPIVMHVSREPKSSAYTCDPHLICSAEKLERVVSNYPQLKICVPHMGTDEFDAYKELIEKYDNLWLDTAMAFADYFPTRHPLRLPEMRTDRIMYGSDFPNLPYAWDRELKRLNHHGLSDNDLALILGKNAHAFFSIDGGIFSPNPQMESL